jgi:haloalkane dehalogenase
VNWDLTLAGYAYAGNCVMFQKRIPGTQNREHVSIKNAGHFLQEDKGEELAQVILDFIEEET